MRGRLPAKGAPRGARRGIGAFELVEAPQAPGETIAADLKDSLADQPGIRLAQPTGRRVFRSGMLPGPQRFTRPPSAPNDTENIYAAVVSNNSRRTLGKSRGAPIGRQATDE